MTRLAPVAVFLLGSALAAPAAADDISDTLQAALEAYEAGDIAKAMEEVSFAQGLLQSKRATAFSDFLPPAPAGWTREISTDMAAGLMMAGGGVGAEGTYSGDGESFSITMVANSPMINVMGNLLSSPMVAMASGAEVKRMGDQKVLVQDNELSAVIANRILIQASGAAPDVMLPVMETIDFNALEDFRF